jgi:hypothetical protein
MIILRADKHFIPKRIMRPDYPQKYFKDQRVNYVFLMITLAAGSSC